LYEHHQAEDAVDHRRHTRQVADVEPDERVEPAGLGVLLEVDAGGNAHREGEQHHEHRDHQRAPDALADAGLVGAGVQVVGEEPGASLLEDGDRLRDDVPHQHRQHEQCAEQAQEERESEEHAAHIALAARERGADCVAAGVAYGCSDSHDGS